ncbi:uncharacterized protein BJ212DRAFT_1303898 [Suillus subaureus]|uniref:Nuclear pore complex protein n=1 Tax=Suillus subaureus TaxID=48587 RepID=A0A9P7DXX5_9AGAM|nr:uncharacterized protein BJ212DRAFT_1303898 [Suillus subaureus]KAG1805835.1 hypothetical protein BJ212DRAFT_1303898 [Suillus subaureus]
MSIFGSRAPTQHPVNPLDGHKKYMGSSAGGSHKDESTSQECSGAEPVEGAIIHWIGEDFRDSEIVLAHLADLTIWQFSNEDARLQYYRTHQFTDVSSRVQCHAGTLEAHEEAYYGADILHQDGAWQIMSAVLLLDPTKHQDFEDNLESFLHLRSTFDEVHKKNARNTYLLVYAGTLLGNNAVKVAVITAEQTINRAFEPLAQMKGLLPSVLALQAASSNIELLLLCSIQWTAFEDRMDDTVLEHATIILQDSLDRVIEYQSLEVSIMNQDTRVAWLSDYKGLLDQVYDAIIKLLTSDWMMPDETGDRHSRKLTQVWQIYVPELILQLHIMLCTSRENLKRVLELVNIVVDSRYKLYDDFLHLNGQRLGEYLGTVCWAMITGLEGVDRILSKLFYHNQTFSTHLFPMFM